MYIKLVRLNGRDDRDEVVVNEVLKSSSLLVWVDVQFTVMMGDALVGELGTERKRVISKFIILWLIILRETNGERESKTSCQFFSYLGHRRERTFFLG